MTFCNKKGRPGGRPKNHNRALQGAAIINTGTDSFARPPRAVTIFAIRQTGADI